MVTMRYGDLAAPVATNFTYDADGKIVFTKGINPNAIKLTISGKNGELKGSFLATAGRQGLEEEARGRGVAERECGAGHVPARPDQTGSTKSGSVSLP